ncbi:MAG TPA: efflux RND transporter periplasmic adaptor subunit [Alphaproteobacteria bacterium]|nr:efflux RND transporter periplasmic adaptor subunit [Alphaproteobacteria bacterium]HNS43871.1 efflux RND transporter periplasmic adaptor subunit [Alphaproteobacteria bacterium]
MLLSKRFQIALLLIVLMGVFALPTVPHADTVAQDGALNVGALAWIEPKSRVLKIGAPNVMEGARVEELFIGEGDDVQKGQVIGTFSTFTKNKASLDVAKANLELAKANLERIKAGNKESDISAQRQTVQSLKALETAAIHEFKRTEELYAQQMVSKSRYDAAKAEQNRLINERKAAESALTSLETVRPDDVLIAENKVTVAQSELDLAKANVDLSTIVAPIDGTILTIYAHSGEAVSGDIGILDMADLSVLDAVAEIDESDILRVKKGQKADVFVSGFSEPVRGLVRELGGQIKRNAVLASNPSQMLDTRIVEVRIEMDQAKNEQLRRLINMKVKATIYP